MTDPESIAGYVPDPDRRGDPCETCGDPVDNKNASGRWRDKCAACIVAKADERNVDGGPDDA